MKQRKGSSNSTGKFKVPSLGERQAAIGCDATSTSPPQLLNFLKSSIELFNVIPEPGEGDWLDEFPTQEDIQPYHQFDVHLRKKFLPSPNKHRQAIYLVPVGTFEKKKSPDLEHLQTCVQRYFCLPVKFLDALQITEELTEEQQQNYREKARSYKHMKQHKNVNSPLSDAYLVNTTGGSVLGKVTVRPKVHSTRTWKQYSTTDLHNILLQMMPEDGFCVVAVLMEDLYAFGMGWVYGEANINERVAVFSFFRHNPLFSTPFYNHVLDERQQILTLLRSCKTLVHEIGHLFGISHCRYFHCCMNGANHMEESDKAPIHLCPIDLHKLYRQIKFSVKDRYIGLRQFYEEVGFEEEKKWVDMALQLYDNSSDNLPNELNAKETTTTTTTSTTTTTTTAAAADNTPVVVNENSIVRCTIMLSGTGKAKLVSFKPVMGIDALTEMACEKLCIKNGRLLDANGEEIVDALTIKMDSKLTLSKNKKTK